MPEFGYETSGIRAPLADILRLFADDTTMTEHVRHWALTGEGMEAFPTDPLDPVNWRQE
jgi:hypothetical protein